MGEHDPRDPSDGDEKKAGFGRKFLGLFVETEDEKQRAAAAPDEEITAVGKVIPPELRASLASSLQKPRPAAAAPSAPTVPSAPVAAVAGERPPAPASYKTPDFPGIFKSVGMTDEERDRLAKAEELLRNLPAETPAALKRQIVEASLRAFSIQPEKISAAATRAVAALDTYLGIGEQDLKARQEAAEKRLAELRQEMERVQAALGERQAMQRTLTFDVRARQSELRTVLDFFGQAPANKG